MVGYLYVAWLSLVTQRPHVIWATSRADFIAQCAVHTIELAKQKETKQDAIAGH